MNEGQATETVDRREVEQPPQGTMGELKSLGLGPRDYWTVFLFALFWLAVMVVWRPGFLESIFDAIVEGFPGEIVEWPFSLIFPGEIDLDGFVDFFFAGLAGQLVSALIGAGLAALVYSLLLRRRVQDARETAVSWDGPVVLETSGVTKVFGGLVAVDDVAFAIPRRSIVSIIGPNGAGKTTFFNMLTGLYRPEAGRIGFAGVDITGGRPDLILSLGVARTFQNIRLFSTMSAVENVMVGAHARMKAGLWGSVVRPPSVREEEREAQKKARELLRYVGLPDSVFDQLAINLSYGDQRRVEIARALAADPKLLLLDEPTAGMNPQESARLTEFMEKLRDERDVTILLIEHDMKVVMGVSERITVLDHGQKISEGPPERVRADDRVIEAYLGKQK